MKHCPWSRPRIRAPRQSIPATAQPASDSPLAGLATLLQGADFQWRRHLGMSGSSIRLATDLPVRDLLGCPDRNLQGPAAEESLPAVVFQRRADERPGHRGWWPALVLIEGAAEAAVDAVRAAGLPLLLRRLPRLSPAPDLSGATEAERLHSAALLAACTRASPRLVAAAGVRFTPEEDDGLTPESREQLQRSEQAAERLFEQSELRAEARAEDIDVELEDSGESPRALVTDHHSGNSWRTLALDLDLESPGGLIDLPLLRQRIILEHGLEEARRQREAP